MLNNMAKYATTEGDLEKYKWVGVIQGYTEANAENNDALPESVLQIAGKDVLSIDESLKNNLSISETEVSKYYVTTLGKVYYQGFEYEGNIYYDKDTIGIGSLSEGENEGENIALGSLVPVITPESKTIMVSVNSVRYKYSKDGGITWEPEEGTTNPNYIFENLDPETEYSIKVMAIDSLGNTTESLVCSTTTLEDTETMDGTYNADKGVNSPKLDTGMIAVYLGYKW
ncbi:MAG: fibronectin type III domain-containing protein [Clostridia bacterium]|nr:fibronectin type III domain-containing protein [Clostridia bacterium]